MFQVRRFLWVFLLLHLYIEATIADSNIVLTQVNAPIKGNFLHLDSTADIFLPEVVKTALNSGVDLIFVTTIRILEERDFLPKKDIAELTLKRQLAYHALTKKYTVDDLTYETRKNFPSLNRALAFIGKYRDISLLEISLIKPLDNTVIQIKIDLSQGDLPLPLRLKSYFSRHWYLSSGWYEWNLR